MTTRYLPSWATAQEAAEWLQAETGEPWPLPRLIESGLTPSVWLTPDGVNPAVFAAVFDGRHEGCLAPLSFASDTHRLAVDRTGTMSITRGLNGELVRFTPPIPFAVDELRFDAKYVRQLAAQAQTSTSAAPLFDLSALATRAELIKAFGVFTDMKIEWFDKLKDTPALLAARKVEGKGARGSTREPLFCAYEVMVWLADKKRKKGHQFYSEDKPWELLENNFPAAYEAHSKDDPRQYRPG